MAVSTGRSWPLHCEVRKETVKGNGKRADLPIAMLERVQEEASRMMAEQGTRLLPWPASTSA